MVKTKDAIQDARSLLGTPYGYGPGEIVCDGVIKHVVRKCPGGVPGWTTAGTDTLWSSYNSSPKYRDLTWRQIGIDGALPGMLVFKGKPTDEKDGQPQHVGLVAERDGVITVIHASSTRGVVEDELRAKDGWTLLGIHRYIEVQEEPMSSTEVQYTATVCTKSGSLNLRSGPGVTYPIVTKIPRGDEVGIITEYDTGWAFVQAGKTTGYVNRDYLSVNPVQPEPEPEPETPVSAHWFVHVPCASEAQARALMELIPGAIMVLGGDD